MSYSFAAGNFILLAFIILINPPINNVKAKFWFSGFLVSVGLALLERDLYPNYPRIVAISECSRFLIAPCLYFSISYFTHSSYTFPKTGFLHFIPFALFTFSTLSFLISDKFIFSLGPQFNQYFGLVLALALKFQILIYWVISFMQLRKHRQNIKLISLESSQINLNWLMNLLFAILVIILIAIFNSKLSNFGNYLPIIYILVCGLIAYYILLQKEIYPFPEPIKAEIQEIINVESSFKKNVARLNPQQIDTLKIRLGLIMETEKPFLQSDINLYDLAEKLGISAHDLSFLLNNGLSINFNDFINNHRINHAKSLLISEKYDHLSIEGIGYESGFSSKSSFFACFKKFVGISPLEFKKSSTNI